MKLRMVAAAVAWVLAWGALFAYGWGRVIESYRLEGHLEVARLNGERCGG